MRFVVLVASVAFGACSQDYEFTVPPDSIVVRAEGTNGDAIATTYGAIMQPCGELARVERRERGDTLFRRLIGRANNNPKDDCPAMPLPLRIPDTLRGAPARSLVLRVEQPDGAPLSRTLVLPFR
jgi:hypothetical protein